MWPPPPPPLAARGRRRRRGAQWRVARALVARVARPIASCTVEAAAVKREDASARPRAAALPSVGGMGEGSAARKRAAARWLDLDWAYSSAPLTAVASGASRPAAPSRPGQGQSSSVRRMEEASDAALPAAPSRLPTRAIPSAWRTVADVAVLTPAARALPPRAARVAGASGTEAAAGARFPAAIRAPSTAPTCAFRTAAVGRRRRRHLPAAPPPGSAPTHRRPPTMAGKRPVSTRSARQQRPRRSRRLHRRRCSVRSRRPRCCTSRPRRAVLSPSYLHRLRVRR